MEESMICPFCKEEIKDGAIKCKHCGSMLNTSVSQSLEDSKPDSPQDIINRLNISQSLKDKFELILEKKYKGIKGGIEISEKSGKMTNLSNWLAFFLTFIYYFYYGIWKKGFMIFVVQIGGAILLAELDAPGIGSLFVLIFSFYIGSIAYIDMYRRLVLKEDFWW